MPKCLVLNVRSWTSSKNDSTTYVCTVAFESISGQGHDVSEMRITPAIYDRLKDDVPCVADIEVGFGSVFQGRAQPTLGGVREIITPKRDFLELFTARAKAAAKAVAVAVVCIFALFSSSSASAQIAPPDVLPLPLQAEPGAPVVTLTDWELVDFDALDFAYYQSGAEVGVADASIIAQSFDGGANWYFEVFAGSSDSSLQSRYFDITLASADIPSFASLVPFAVPEPLILGSMLPASLLLLGRIRR